MRVFAWHITLKTVLLDDRYKDQVLRAFQGIETTTGDHVRDGSFELTDSTLAYGDCTPCRYLVDGEICEVPHDRCPSCWAGWSFKIGTPDADPATLECPCCGYELGQQIKLMLDDDRWVSPRT